MAGIEFLATYNWMSDSFPVCTVNVPMADLAARLSLPLVSWVEPGLGEAVGFGCKLESGDVVFLEELVHAREHLGALGPTVYMEASTLAELGAQGSLRRVLQGLSLTQSDISWVQTEVGVESARQVALRARADPRLRNDA